MRLQEQRLAYEARTAPPYARREHVEQRSSSYVFASFVGFAVLFAMMVYIFSASQ